MKTVDKHSVEESTIAKIDQLEKNLIKIKYQLQIVRKDLYNNLEKEQKEKLIQDLQKYGENAVAELVKVFTVQEHKKIPKKMDQIKRLPTRDIQIKRNNN